MLMLRTKSLSQAVTLVPRALLSTRRAMLIPQTLPEALWPAQSHRYSSGSKSELRLEDIPGPVDLRVHNQATLRRLAREIVSASQLTTVNIHILGTGGNEVGPSFLLDCSTGMYLFNCGEGWVRNLASRMKRPVLFFSRASWENFSGCCGLYHRMEFPRLDYCGPPRSNEFIEYISRYSGRDTWRNVVQRDGKDNRVFQDQNLLMTFVDINSPEANDVGSLVAYSCKLADVDGKFQPEKAAELGVEPGPAYKLLTHGLSIITKSGDLVQPFQVVENKRKGPTFLVVDCPSERFVDPVTSNPHLQPEWFREREQSVGLIVHMTPLDILEREQYCKWLASFGQGTKHLLLHGSVCPGEVGYRAAMTFSLPFHLLNPNVYHFPRFPDSNVIPKSSLAASKHVGEDSITIGQMFMRYHLKPQLAVDTSECLEPLEKQLHKDLERLKSNSWVIGRMLEHRRALSVAGRIDVGSVLKGSVSPPELRHSKDALVTILGTSAAYSGKWRNVSGILIQTLKDGNILLDCGEGTLNQLRRAFGRSVAKDILQKLKVIFISHLHPDHHMGAMAILQEATQVKRARGDSETINLISISSFYKVLNRLRATDGTVDYQALNSSRISISPFYISEDLTIQTVEVDHLRPSYGAIVRRTGQPDWSLVYSGDTAPCDNLIRAGQNATLLIHEGTFEEEFKERAVEQRHSTYREALQVADAMMAKFVIPTHFSNRCTLFPLNGRYHAPNASPAVDLMSVRISDLHNQMLDSPLCAQIFERLRF